MKVSIVPLLQFIFFQTLRLVLLIEPYIPSVLIAILVGRFILFLVRFFKLKKNVGVGMTLEYYLTVYFSWIPFIKKEIDEKTTEMTGEMENMFKYNDPTPHASLPEVGLQNEEIMAELAINRQPEKEQVDKQGTMFCGNYVRDQELLDLQKQIFFDTMKCNGLYITNYKSIRKCEAEIAAMVVTMLNGTDGCCGVMTSGGTESILMAMKTYRDYARKQGKKGRLNIVAPDTIHCAFHKASKYFDIDLRLVPTIDGTVTLRSLRKYVNRKTIVVACSAPSYPHGILDPVEEIAAFCERKGIGCHVDNCLGGFVLSFLDHIPPWDYRVPGVTSISTDVHKWGGALKGCSVVSYRTKELRRCQYYIAESWSGGIAFTIGFQGSRNGGLSAAAWASMLKKGAQGYRLQAQAQMIVFNRLLSGLRAMPEVQIIGEPCSLVIGFTLIGLDDYQLVDALEKVYHCHLIARLQFPKCMHIMVADRLVSNPEMADQLLTMIRSAIDEIVAHPEKYEEAAALYGSAATIPNRNLVGGCLEVMIDSLLKPQIDES